MPPADQLDLLALTLVPGLGPRLTQALLDHFGSAAAVRAATRARLREVPRIGDKLADAFVAALTAADPQAEFDRTVAHGVTLLPVTSVDYPEALKGIDDAPHLLYVRG